MKKRVIAVFLLLAIFLSLAIPVNAAGSAQDLRRQIRDKAATLILNYANSGKLSNSPVAALDAFLYHSMFRGGQKMTVKESDHIVSAAFHSNMFQEALTEAITDAIVTSQELNLDQIFLTGSVNWHTFLDNYSFTAYLAEKKVAQKRLGTLASSKQIYGDAQYPGLQNNSDTIMQIIAGSLHVELLVTRSSVKESSVVYNLQMKFYDDFSFDSTYESAEKKGYDATIDKLLVGMGGFFGKFLLNDFYWEFSKDFQIEVPYSCDHSNGNYSWVLNTDGTDLTNITTDGFLPNGTQRQTYTNSNTGENSYYYQLNEPVYLYHNQPWTVEYDAYKIKSFALSPTESAASLPYLYQYSRYHTWAVDYDYFPKDAQTGTQSTYTNHYYGARIQDQFKYYSSHTYTYTLQNIVNADGSNMIWVSVYDNDLGETVLAPTPMDDYYRRHKGESSSTLISEENNWVSGQDFIINYIGTKSYRISSGSFSLRIWESGKGVSEISAFVSQSKSPTCTADGGAVHTCQKCGYSYGQVLPATGHSFGTYTSDGNASCDADGTKTAKCIVCGASSTVVEEGTAMGHQPEVLAGMAPTCDVPGLTEGSKCARCHQILSEQQILPAPGHSWLSATCTTPQTCAVCAITQGEAAGHKELILPGKNATCTTEGLTEGKICQVCSLVLIPQDVIPVTSNGHSWKEANCTMPRTCTVCGTTEGDALGHNEVIIPGKAPGCTEEGLTEGTLCSSCGTVTLAQQTILASGHNWQEATTEKPKTCLLCGVTEGGVHVHKESVVPGKTPSCTEGGLTDGVVCTDCGIVLVPQTLISATGHNWQAATCTAPISCTLCGATEGIALGHNSLFHPGKAATCVEPGFTDSETCSVCMATIVPQNEIPALGHSWKAADCHNPKICTACSATDGEPAPHEEVTVPGKAPTCTTEGLTDGKVCQACGTVLAAQGIIPVVGHDWQEATCQSPKTCTRCGGTSGAPLAHDVVAVEGTAATCTEPGLTDGSHCAACDAELKKQEVIAPIGHSWREADCITPKTCIACDATEGEAAGHNPVTDEAKAPGCTEAGFTEGSHCGQCNEILVNQQIVAATGHLDADVNGSCDTCGSNLVPETTPPTEPVEPQDPTNPSTGDRIPLCALILLLMLSSVTILLLKRKVTI